MSLWPIARLLCVCESHYNDNENQPTFWSTCWKPGVMLHRNGNHSSLALGFGAATTAGTRDILLSIWTVQRVIAVISSIRVPKWHRALTSTHLLPIPGFWLGLPNRQENQLTMPATSQDIGPKIIDRIHFQLPSWVLSTTIHQQNESTPWGAWVGFMTG